MSHPSSYGGRVAALAKHFAGVYATSWPARSPEERAALIDSFVLDLVISGQISRVDADDLRVLRSRVSDELAACHAMASPHARPDPGPPRAAEATDAEVADALRQLDPETLATMLVAGRAWLTPHQFRALVAALRGGGRVVAGKRRVLGRGTEYVNAAAVRALVRRGYLDHEATPLGGTGGTLSERTRAAVAAMWRDWSARQSDRRPDRMTWRSMSDREVVVLRPDGGPHLRIICEMATDEELARAADAVVRVDSREVARGQDP